MNISPEKKAASDIFLSYAHEDLKRARELAKALGAQGWSVFWDRTIPPGKTWRGVIGKALEAARCVIVVWSEASILSGWVCEEADVARERKTLVPVLFDAVLPPMGFRSIQAASLVDWNGDTTAEAFQQLLQAVAEIIGSPNRVSATQAPARERTIESDSRTPRAAGQRAAIKGGISAVLANYWPGFATAAVLALIAVSFASYTLIEKRDGGRERSTPVRPKAKQTSFESPQTQTLSQPETTQAGYPVRINVIGEAEFRLKRQGRDWDGPLETPYEFEAPEGEQVEWELKWPDGYVQTDSFEVRQTGNKYDFQRR